MEPLVAQVNSDSRATEEYFDFLLNKTTIKESEDQPSVIVGDGRIGSMLLDFGSRRKFEDVTVTQGELIPADHPGPVYVCTPAPALADVVASCPEEKKEDLVFLSDGQLEPLFMRNGLFGNTQAALWMTVMRRGGKPVDGLANENLVTTVSGKWSGALGMRLNHGGLACRELSQRDARRSILERLVFVSAYNLVGAVHGGITLGEVASKHADEVDAMCRELASFIRYTLSVSLFAGVDERLASYAHHLEFLPTSITDFPFRNGYFYKYSKMAGTRVNPAGIKVDVPDTTPIHTEYLLFARDEGIITQELLDSV